MLRRFAAWSAIEVGRTSRAMRHVLLGAAALTLALAAMPSCVLVAEPGTGVELSLRVAEPSDADVMQLHVADAALVACPEPRTALPSLRSVARAHHVVADGARLGESHVVSLREHAVLGRLEPTVGRYCALEVILMPAHDLDGWTLRASGTSTDGAPWAADGYAMRRWHVPLEAPLSVDAQRPAASLELVVDPAAALAEVDTTGDAADLGLDLILALERTARARAGP